MAEILGYDAFVAMWRHLSANPALRNDDNQIDIRLRSIRSYDVYQRNRYIETLSAAGLTLPEIRSMVQSRLGEKLSHRHILRLTTQAKVRA